MGKITALADKGNYQGKSVRKVSIDGVECAAWEKVADMLDSFKVGDEVSSKISDNGKYLLFVARPGTAAPTGGGHGGKGGGADSKWTKDPEKDTAVYTSYVLDYMTKAKNAPGAEEAVKQVMAVRALVQKALAPKEAANTEAVGEADKIKHQTIFGLLKGIDVDAAKEPWPTFIGKMLKTKTGFASLQNDISDVANGSKKLVALEDGTPVFLPF